jgi:hypothetical protein
MRTCLITLLTVGVISTPCSAAELTLNRIAATFGSIQPLGWNDAPNVFYPELQVQGVLLTRGIGWESFWGYWDDGITQVQVRDAIVYSSSGHMLGARVSVDPKLLLAQWPLPIVVWGGVAHQFISLNDLGYTDFAGSGGYDHAIGANSWEFGGRALIGLTNKIGLQLDARHLYYLGDELPGLSRDNRWNVNLGIGFTIE